ncbi:MAG: hypothetical protein B7Z66_00660 [Chromatiales bacterium 21-64-14]|nr:MAG: hypothetical protein B7Z66_00660 [Chromatiales bacterium 21-64-14]HQU15542.1 general secretion pathway protein GspF [Gammaproteobacteria bacterium]
MQRPRTAKEYFELVDQTLFEIEELRWSAEYDAEDLGGALKFLDPLEAEVRKLRAQMLDGTYHFGNADLQFMEIVAQQNTALLPFKSLLQSINQTHKHGLLVDEE